MAECPRVSHRASASAWRREWRLGMTCMAWRASNHAPLAWQLLHCVQLSTMAAMQEAGAVTALAFSADAAHLAVAATGGVLLYDLLTYGLSDWSHQHGTAMASCLKGLGHIRSISFQPADKVRQADSSRAAQS